MRHTHTHTHTHTGDQSKDIHIAYRGMLYINIYVCIHNIIINIRRMLMHIYTEPNTLNIVDSFMVEYPQQFTDDND